MKLSSVCVGLVAGLSLFSSQGRDRDAAEAVYMTLDAGGNLMGNVQHPYTDLTLHMEPGARFDAAIGLNFFKSDVINIGADVEMGLIYNGINHGTLNGVSTRASGYLLQVPGLINARFQFVPSSNWNPYVGIGGGAIRSTLSFDLFHTSDEIEPAAQATAGVTYNAGDVVSAGIGYKYLAAFPSDLKRVANHAVLVVIGFNY